MSLWPNWVIKSPLAISAVGRVGNRSVTMDMGTELLLEVL